MSKPFTPSEPRPRRFDPAGLLTLAISPVVAAPWVALCLCLSAPAALTVGIGVLGTGVGALALAIVRTGKED